MQIRHFYCVRNDGDGAAILLQLCDGEADAFDRNRTLVDGIFFDVIGQFNVQPPVFRFGDALEREQLADSVHVSLDYVSAKRPSDFMGSSRFTSAPSRMRE